jgi:hypothetical protein
MAAQPPVSQGCACDQLSVTMETWIGALVRLNFSLPFSIGRRANPVTKTRLANRAHESFRRVIGFASICNLMRLGRLPVQSQREAFRFTVLCLAAQNGHG